MKQMFVLQQLKHYHHRMLGEQKIKVCNHEKMSSIVKFNLFNKLNKNLTDRMLKAYENLSLYSEIIQVRNKEKLSYILNSLRYSTQN